MEKDQELTNEFIDLELLSDTDTLIRAEMEDPDADMFDRVQGGYDLDLDIGGVEDDLLYDEDQDSESSELIAQKNAEETYEDILFNEISSSYYIYSKMFRSEYSFYRSNSRKLLPDISTTYKINNKDPRVKMCVELFDTYIGPLLKAKDKSVQFDNVKTVVREATAIRDHVIELIEGMTATTRYSENELFGDRLRFVKGTLVNGIYRATTDLISLIKISNIPIETIRDVLSHRINLMASAMVEQTAPPIDLSVLVNEIPEIYVMLPGSRMLLSQLDTIGPNEKFVASRDVLLERYTLCNSLRVNDKGRIIGQCTCHKDVDLTDTLKVVTNANSIAKNRTDNYWIMARPEICPNCGKGILLRRDAIAYLVRGITVYSLESNTGSVGLIETGLSYSVMCIVQKYLEKTGYYDSTILVNSSIGSDKSGSIRDFLDYVTSVENIAQSTYNYKKEVSYTLSKLNGITMGIQGITDYVYNKLSNKTVQFLKLVENKNELDSVMFASYKIRQKLKAMMEDKECVYSQALKQEGLFDKSDVPDPIKTFSTMEDVLSNKVGKKFINSVEDVECEVREILQSQVDHYTLTVCCSRQTSMDKFFYNGLGKLVENIVLNDYELMESFYNNVLASYLYGAVRVKDSSGINLPTKLKITDKVSKAIMSLIDVCSVKNVKYVDVDRMFTIIDRDISVFKPVAATVYSQDQKPVFETHKCKIMPVLGGILDDDLEYLRELGTAKRIRRDYLQDQELAAEYEDKAAIAGMDLSNERYALIRALLDSFSIDSWPNPQTYYVLTNAINFAEGAEVE